MSKKNQGYRHYLSDDDTNIPRSSWYRFRKQQENSENAGTSSYGIYYKEPHANDCTGQHVAQSCEMQIDEDLNCEINNPVASPDDAHFIDDEHFELDDIETHLPFWVRAGESEIIDATHVKSHEDDTYDCYGDEEYFDAKEYFENEAYDGDHYESLDDLLHSDGVNEKLEVSFNVSKPELLLSILRFSLRNSLTSSAIEELCIMLNSLVNTPIVPETRYSINKLFGRENYIQYYGVCPKCSTHRQKFCRNTHELLCLICERTFSVKGDEANFFVVLDVREKVKTLIEENSEFYDLIMENVSNDGFIHDIYDGIKYKDFRQSLPVKDRKSFITCILNTDGSPVFKKSNCSIVPVQISINELPPDIRVKNPITWALWFGKGKPNIDILMETFVETFTESSGIKCNINNISKDIKLYTICSCVDSVARAPMQGMVQFNGYYGCPWCLHPGVPIQHKNHKTIKYPLLDTIPQERTESDTLIYMELMKDKNSQKSQSIYGIKRTPPLIELPHFDIIKGFVPDVMHLLFLGICRQFAKYWFDTSRKPYSLSNQIEFIDEMIMKIKLPHQLARPSKLISERKWWNSRDWENWCLYYSSPILSEIPHFSEYVQHWNLIVEAIKLLLSDKIHKNEIIQADKLLHKFVADTEKLYSAKAMTFNIHQLLHLAQSVIDFGPLWAHSCYTFEDGNGRILKMIKAAKGVLLQICRYLEFEKTSMYLDKHVKKIENSPVERFCFHMDNHFTLNSTQLDHSACRYFGKSIPTSQQWIDTLHLTDEDTSSFKRMIKSSCIYSSSERRMTRCNNSFARTNEGIYINIIEFVVDETKDREFTLCRIVTTEPLLESYQQFIKIVDINPEVVAIKTDLIQSIAVFLEVNGKKYISNIPNMLHY